MGLVEAAPFVAMDLVIVRGGTEVLLGMRKNETIQADLERVALAELDLHIATLPQPSVHLGAFEHIYDDCFTGDVGVSTHYVVMGNLVQLPASAELSAADDQHQASRWWPRQQAMAATEIHRFTKDYVRVLLSLQREGGLHA